MIQLGEVSNACGNNSTKMDGFYFNHRKKHHREHKEILGIAVN